MIDTLGQYFQSFLRPTRRSSEEGSLTYFEVLGISWSLHLVYAFYSIFAIYLGVASYEYLSNSDDFSHLLFESMNVTFQKFSLMMILFEVIFYPFIFQFAFKFWSHVLRFYAEIFEYDDLGDLDGEIESLMNSLFAANIFLMIPILGNVLSYLTQGLYLFVGLRSKLRFTRLQAFFSAYYATFF